jgi:hypothetical protein
VKKGAKKKPKYAVQNAKPFGFDHGMKTKKTKKPVKVV